jgi:dTMP kinase
VAFLGGGRGLDLELIARMNNLATGGLRPNLTLVFDLDPRLARARRESAPVGGLLGAFDEASESFHDRVRAAYARLAAENPDRVSVVDASGRVRETQERVMSLLDPLLVRRE